MTSRLYTLRYDEGKVTRSYHNEINEALCGKILKMYPAKDKFNTKIPYQMSIGHMDGVLITKCDIIFEITNDYIWNATLRNLDTRSYNTKLIYLCPVYARCNIFRVKFHWKYQQLWCLLLFHVSHKLSFCYQEKLWTICILFLKWPRKPFIFWHAIE